MIGVRRVDILGCPFDAISFAETVASIRSAVVSNDCLQIVPGSIDFIIKARRDQTFARVLWNSNLVIADGKPIVWLASMLGTPIKRRVSGTDLVWACAQVSQELCCPIALLGGVGDTARRAATKMRTAYPEAQLHAIETPYPLTDKVSEIIAQKVRSLNCRIVLLALGAPRQERWVQRYLHSTGANVAIGIGSAFDIISGDRPRAPRWMQDGGLEWFYRMMQEPRRLGKRYLIEDLRVFWYLASALLHRSQGAGGRHEQEKA